MHVLSAINTPYCHFAMTTLNSKLLIAGGKDKSYENLTMDAGQLKNYTKMTTARSRATATGHQGMLIITGHSVAMNLVCWTKVTRNDSHLHI